jgi:hypothetical protein
MGHIKWSPLAISQAMDKAEKEIAPIFEHLDRAYETVTAALAQPNLPQYIRQSLGGLQGEIGSLRHEDPPSWHSGRLQNAIGRVRGDLPKENLKVEKAQAKVGKPLSLPV